ncbi:hypothetical protein [Acidisarcina polymorpha]|uniref:hypothetical protein n=1 Tax=Acidisarcina polymorpha TaxID=2211140 RepID=UPI000DF012EC|nr:hypothetical protein [Acidisarcina polymorpha]
MEALFSGATFPAIAPVSGTLHLAAGAVFDWNPQVIVLSNGEPFPGQPVTWTAGAGTALSSTRTSSGPGGITWTQSTVGPLPLAGNASISACIASGTELGRACVAFTIASSDPASAGLTALSGTNQVLSTSDSPAPLVLKVVDALANPVAGAFVTFYETLRQWRPPCPSQGTCPFSPLVQQQTVQAISDADGLVNVNPLTDGVIATHLEVLAVTGINGSVLATIDRHP